MRSVRYVNLQVLKPWYDSINVGGLPSTTLNNNFHYSLLISSLLVFWPFHITIPFPVWPVDHAVLVLCFSNLYLLQLYCFFDPFFILVACGAFLYFTPPSHFLEKNVCSNYLEWNACWFWGYIIHLISDGTVHPAK